MQSIVSAAGPAAAGHAAALDPEVDHAPPGQANVREDQV